MNIIAPLIVVPVLTKGMGVSIYGEYMALVSLVAMMTVIFDLGLGMYIPKIISDAKKNDEKVKAIWLFFILRIICYPFYSLLVCVINGFSYESFVLIVYLTLMLINPEPLLIGFEKYKQLAIANCFAKGFIVVAALTIDFTNEPIIKAIKIQIASLMIITVISMMILVFLIRKEKLVISSVNKLNLNINAFIKECAAYYFARLATNIYQSGSTYLVSIYFSSNIVGVYAVGVQLYKVGQSIVGAVARVLYTSTIKTKTLELVKKATMVSLLIYVIGFVVVVFAGEGLLSILFSFDIYLLYRFSILLYVSLFFVIISSYWGYPVLTAMNKDNYAHAGILLSSLLYFISFSVFVYFFIPPSFEVMASLTGLALCILLSDLSGMLLRIYFIFKVGALNAK